MVQIHIDEGMLLDAMEEEVRERGVATVYMCLEGAELISGVLPKDMCGFRWMLTEDLNFKGLVSEAEVFPFLLSSFNYRPGIPADHASAYCFGVDVAASYSAGSSSL